MMRIRHLVAAVILAVALAAPAFAQSGSKKGQTDGTFAGIEQGDYAHFLVKQSGGRQESFFILRPDKSVQSYLDNSSKLKGRRVRVYWQEREENIPEAGGKQRIKVVTKVEERK
jgi:hypothetical protein